MTLVLFLVIKRCFLFLVERKSQMVVPVLSLLLCDRIFRLVLNSFVRRETVPVERTESGGRERL